VTFATFIVYCTLQFALRSGRTRYYWGLAALCSYGLFLWWWDQAHAVVSVIFLATSLIALLVFYRPEKREGYIFIGILAGLVLLLFFWQGFELPQKIYDTIASKYYYIHTSKISAGIFPNQAITVSEQVRPGFDEIITKSTGSAPIFFTACAGLLYLFYRRPKESLFLIVPLVLASLSFLFAKRFLIFLNPITALGLGSFIGAIWFLRKRYAIAAYIAPVVLLILVWPNLSDNLKRVHWPKEPGSLVAGMAAAEKSTPDDAVIWTWWDHGYNMRYWSDRGVIADGSHHEGEVSMYNALPLTVSSEQLSANFIHFYVSRGQKGMAQVYRAFDNQYSKAMQFLLKILSGDAEQAGQVIKNSGAFQGISGANSDLPNSIAFYFPPNKKPVYLFLDWRLTITSYWWFWFGSWDFDKREGIHPGFELFQNIGIQNNQIMGRGMRSGLQADLKTGIVKLGNKHLPMARIAFFEPDGKVKVAQYKKNSGLSLEVSAVSRCAALVDPAIGNSVFNKLYLRRQYDPKYFELVDEKFPAWQLWKVQGDE
jgi:dolichyl-diphosphooligosaccharide--protein glycosyltransferase